ncbi:hypothetical protein Tco_0427733 [Tanacetum coccineum]
MLPPLQLERYMPDIGIKQVDHMIKSTTTTNPQITTQKAPHTSVNHINSLFLKKDTNGVIKVLPPKTAEEILARERERKAMTTLLMALPEDHLAKFHKMTDAKDMWDAIKSRFGGNDESKKMQKYILKQQFEGFSISNSEGLHKGYDRFQSLLSQLEIHGAGVSTEDANQKFLVLPSPGPILDEFDLEEMDLKWQVAMISMNGSSLQGNREKAAFDAKVPFGFDKNQRNTGYKSKDNERRPGKQEEPKALVTLDGEGVDWTDHAEDEQENFALMAYSNSGSNTEGFEGLPKWQEPMWGGEGGESDVFGCLLQAHTNHQNQFVPTVVLTRTGRIPVNTASHNFNSQAVSTSAARKVNAVRPIVNENRPRNNFHKSHSPIRRPFNRTTAPRTKFSNQKVNTAEENHLSAVGGKRETEMNSYIRETLYEVYLQRFFKMTTPVLLVRKEINTRPPPVRSENQANKNEGPKEANHSAVKSSEANNKGEKSNKNTGLKTNEEHLDQKECCPMILRSYLLQACAARATSTTHTKLMTASAYTISMKTASTPIETQKSLTKDEEAADVDVIVIQRPLILKLLREIFSTMLEQIFYKKTQQMFVKFLAGDTNHGNVKKQIIVATSTYKMAEYVEAPTALCKYCGFKSNVRLWFNIYEHKDYNDNEEYYMQILQMDDDDDDDDEIYNYVDLHKYMLGGGWKGQDLQGLLWWIIIEVCLQQNES